MARSLCDRKHLPIELERVVIAEGVAEMLPEHLLKASVGGVEVPKVLRVVHL